ALDQRDRLEDRLAVALDERFGRSGPGPNPLQVAAPGLDPDEVVPEVVQLLADAAGASLADRHGADDGGNADRDPEHRQRRPQLVAGERRQGYGQDGREVHHPRSL